MNRIFKTLREGHVDFSAAVAELKLAVYSIVPIDLAAVIEALKNGTMNGKKHTDEEINEMKKRSKQWKKNYSHFLCKQIHPASLITSKLKEWWNRYKCSASPGEPEG